MRVIQRVFQRAWRGYVRAHPQPLSVHKAAVSIRRCRTAEAGHHLWVCPDGHHRERASNSCGHRCCAQCAFVQTERWVRRQLARLIRCDYYHVVFTIPHELNVLWRYNRKLFSQLLFDAAWHTLRELLGDPRHLGALPGAIGSLHTWQQTLLEHVHVHMLVTAGGIGPDGQWVAVAGKYLIYPRVVAELFRGKLLAYLREALAGGELVPPAGMSAERCRSLFNGLDRNRREAKRWHVQIMPRYAHGRGVLGYLSRYVKGGPISQGRIVADTAEGLRIRYKRGGEEDGRASARRSSFTLSSEEFIGRFVRHVPPAGMHTVRSYGLFHHARRELLDRARLACGQLPYEAAADESVAALAAALPDYRPRLCPVCGKPLRFVPPARHGPPTGIRAGPQWT